MSIAWILRSNGVLSADVRGTKKRALRGGEWQRLDNESQLHNVRHRTYHAELGVWVQNVETGTQLNVETGTQLVLTGEESRCGAWRKRRGDASL
jgi:hypothetical protein